MSFASPASDESKAADWQAIVEKGRTRLDREGREIAGALEGELNAILAEAITQFESADVHSSTDASDVSSAEPWLFLGQLRELQGGQEKLLAAVEAYAKSHAAARGRSPRQERLAAMNRGNALSKLGQIDAALVAYDQALGVEVHQRSDDLADELTLGALHLNRGAALETIPSGRSDEALESYRRAIEVFTRVVEVASKNSPDYRQAHYLLAGTRLNLAVNLLSQDHGQAEAALAVACEVSESMEAESRVVLSAADFALRALRLQCEISGRKISEMNAREKNELSPWLSRATDWAEDALGLAGHWEQTGEAVFRPAVSWFVAFAAALYTHHQPHFLGEFLTEVLRGDGTPQRWRQSPDLDEIALSALDAAQSGVRGWLFHDPSSPEAQQQLSTLENLRRARAIFQSP